MILVAIFQVENNTFAEQLRIIVQEDETTQVILKRIS